MVQSGDVVAGDDAGERQAPASQVFVEEARTARVLASRLGRNPGLELGYRNNGCLLYTSRCV